MTATTEPVRSAGIWVTFRDAPVAVKAILTGVFINRLGGLLNLFLVLFLTSKGYSTEEAGLALGAYGGGAVVGVLIGGSLADRLGPRAATVISMAGTGVLLATLLYVPSYPLILVVVVLVSLVGQMYRPASSTLLAELTPKPRLVMTMAMYRFGLNLGSTAAPLIGFAIYNASDQQYTLLFWADASAALLYAVVAFFALPPRRPGQPAVGPAESAAPKVSYLAVLEDRRYVLYLVAALINGIVYVQYMSTLPLDITAQGVAIFWYSVAVSMNGLMVIAFELLLTKLSQKWPFPFTVGLTYTLVGSGVALYGLPLGPAVIVIGTLVWTFAEIVGSPAVFSYPALAGPAHLKGRYIGSFQFMFGLGTAAGPLVGSALFARLGHGVWPVLGAFGAVATLLAVAGVRTPAKVPAAEDPAKVPAADDPAKVPAADDPAPPEAHPHAAADEPVATAEATRP